MIPFDNFMPTAELQATDAAHHMHPFSEGGKTSPEEFGLIRARELEDEIARQGVHRVAAFIAELTPDKAARAAFASPAGTVGHRCRERCFANNLIMRHAGDAMIVSPPLVIGMDEIDILTERAWRALDETLIGLRADDLMRVA